MKARLIAATALFLLGALVTSAQPACSAAGGSVTGIGDPCIPLLEREPTFRGFDEKEVNLETSSPSCSTGVCLINHFRGRVSCPYGQDASGAGPAGTPPCTTSDNKVPVTGDANDPRRQALVPPQCVDRTGDKTVYCSCRCANDAGRTDDGLSYCACPAGFECAPVVTSIGASSRDLAGSYCVKRGTIYNADTACSQGDCDPIGKKCG
jgi:hypothetical protein